MASKQAQAIQSWWRWFVEHEDEIWEGLGRAMPLYEHCRSKLRAIHPNLAIDLTSRSDRTHDLILTSEGDESLWPLVMQVVEAAPRLKWYTVHGFRPAQRGHFSMQYGEKLVQTVDLFCRVLPTEKAGRLEIDLWVIDQSPVQQDWQAIGERVVQTAVGEVWYRRHITRVKTEILDQSNPPDGLRPFVEIYDWLKLELVGLTD